MQTIVAEATPKGRGGVGIVRLSGPLAQVIAEKICGKILKLRHAEFVSFKNAEQILIDQGIALSFKAPHSFTGEDVVELQCHGGPILIDQLIETALTYGASLAKPGEFTERAFLNDKIDLVQAEAISDLINAQTRASARAAVRSLQGEFSGKINTLLQKLIHLRIFIEATLDFPDEEIEFVENAKVIESLTEILHIFITLQSQAETGVLLNEGIYLALIGKPNAGKSSLMNQLTGQDTAIVSEVAGTTRDLVKEKITIAGLPVHVIDTAGLRESIDTIEQEGIRRTHKALKEADIIVILVDCRSPQDLTEMQQKYDLDLQSRPFIIVWNKIDLLVDQSDLPSRSNEIKLSAKTGYGLEDLTNLLLEKLDVTPASEGQFMARRRHLDALTRAGEALQKGLEYYAATASLELLAEECRIAQSALAEITGEFRSDDLLGAIFSTFCIGK